VSISNSISSLRFLGAADWREFVETRSGVERTQREDPSRVYPLMDFATRDQYRHVVEALARRSGRTEGDVARLAVHFAQDSAAAAGEDARTAHVGYYLVDRGLSELERAVRARFPLGEKVRRLCLAHPLTPYLGSILALTVFPAAGLPGATRSQYSRLWASDLGVDPYTRVVSDVYQDLFQKGSFIGKGIYDVDAFELAVGGRFPENRILSHDLLEGSYARAGLLTDVQVYEEHPARYDDDVRRRYRLIRGDWQLWRWLLPGPPGRDLRSARRADLGRGPGCSPPGSSRRVPAARRLPRRRRPAATWCSSTGWAASRRTAASTSSRQDPVRSRRRPG
jgi:hypothetical protein